MKQKLEIKVSKDLSGKSILSYKKVSIGKRLFKKLFGRDQKVVILIPGETVEGITISERDEGGEDNATRKTQHL